MTAAAPEVKRRGRGGNKRTKKEAAAPVLAEPTVAVPEVVVEPEAIEAPAEKKPAARARRPRKPKATPEGGESE